METSRTNSEAVVKDSTEDRKMELNLKEYHSALKNMKITDDGVAKVVLKKHIVSAAFHPCTSSLLMATGNILGNVGLWKLGSVCCMDVEKAVFDDKKNANAQLQDQTISRVGPQTVRLFCDGEQVKDSQYEGVS